MMEELASFNNRNSQQKKRRRFLRSSCLQPATLAMIFSGLVLVAYTAGIIGVVLLLDQHRTTSSSSRQLEISPEDVVEHSTNDLIPVARWPVTLRDEVDTYITIPHPVDKTAHFTVPKFWSPPIHNNQLMSRETAMKIGSCTVPDASGNFARGADCPVHQRTIFIMIASYRDYQCRETLESIYFRASHPERIRVGVVDQIIEGTDSKCHEPIKPCVEDPQQALCQYAHLIDTLTLDPQLSVGPVPARHIGYRMYRGEYYAAQSDAHVNYTNNWEMALIHELESTGNEMAVLSTYLSDFVGAIDKNGDSLRHERPIMCNSYWQEWNKVYHVHHSTQPECAPEIRGMPQLHPWWAAGFSFARGHFVVNVPYDYYMPMVFSGEEMSIAIRGWTVGYDFYTPERSVCFHHYAESDEGRAKRANVPTFWDNGERYKGSGIKGIRRLLGILHMGLNDPPVEPDTWDHADEDIYGMGGVRTSGKFMDLLGIDVKNLQMEGHLCRFVRSGEMHKRFMAHLRDDGMGIDYSQIDFRWKDPENQVVNSSEAEKAEGGVAEEKNDGDDEAEGEEAKAEAAVA